MIRSGVGLIVDRRFVERNVGRQTMTGTDCHHFGSTSGTEVFLIQLFLELLTVLVMFGHLLLVLQLRPLLLHYADREDAEKGDDGEGDDEDRKEGEHVPGEVEQGRVHLLLRRDPPRPVLIALVFHPRLYLSSLLF